MRYALTADGVVVNVILLNEPDSYTPDEGIDLVSLEDHPDVGIGWASAGGEWIDMRPTPDPDPVFVPPVIRQQSPSGMWWEQKVNDDGETVWVPVDLDDALNASD